MQLSDIRLMLEIYSTFAAFNIPVLFTSATRPAYRAYMQLSRPISAAYI